MARGYQRYSEEFRAQAEGRMRAGAKIRLLSMELKVHTSLLYRWKSKLLRASVEPRYESEDQRREREWTEQRALLQALQGKIGEQAMDLDFFRAALRRVGAKIPVRGLAGKNRSALRSAAGVKRKAE